MFVLAAIPWELVGILGGTFCCGSFFLSVVSTLGIIIYRAQTGSTRDRRAASQPTLPAESPQTAELLTSVVGYRASGDQKRTRERWGRPVTYTRTPTEGAHWFTPANGIQLTLMERNGRPGGILTGDAKLDDRFLLETDTEAVAPTLRDPDLRERLLALPRVHLVSDGRAVTFVDDQLKTHEKVCAPYDPTSAEGRSRQVVMHDSIADILVLIADRIG